MSYPITRQHASGTIYVATSTSISSAMEVEKFAGGAIKFPSDFSAASVWFQGSNDADPTTFTRIFDDDGNAISVTVTTAEAANGWVNIKPDCIFPFHRIRIETNATLATGITFAYAVKG